MVVTHVVAEAMVAAEDVREAHGQGIDTDVLET